MSRGREILVGSVIIAAVLVAVLGTLWLKGTNWGRPSVEVQVLLRDVAQLTEGNAVKFRGVRVGKVSAIDVEPEGGAVRVTLLLDRELALPEDAAVVIAPESLFGDWQAEIVSRAAYPGYAFHAVPEGREQAPPARPGGDPVPVLGGYALPELSRLTASAEQISANLAVLSERFEVAFNEETASNLALAIENIERVSRQLRELVDQQAEVAMSVTTSADSALAEIEEASRVARRSFERIEEVLTRSEMDTLVADVSQAAASLQEIAANLTAPSADLSTTLARADSAFARIDRIAARVEAGEGALGRLVGDSTLVLRTEDVLAQLDRLLQDLRENPSRYVRLSIF